MFICGKHYTRKHMNNKTIGILTHWSIPNYGSFLQAYALSNILKTMYPDYDVRQIAYMNKVHAKMYYAMEVHELFRFWLINPKFYFDVLNRLKRRKQIQLIRNFKEYYNTIPHTRVFDEKSITDAEVDYLVLGSDIIWDYSISFYNHDMPVFGHKIKSKKALSYAASFGTVKRNNMHPKYVSDGINKLDYISVRDINSKLICEDITNRNIEIVLDPTLLWDFQNDTNIVTPKIDYDYVAVYGSYFSDKQIKTIKDYCKHNRLKIIYLDSVGDICEWCDVFIDATTMTPFEWCGYIKNSKILMTCTFHGLLFGLIFNKRIVFNGTDFMKDKATEFIRYLELEDNLLLENRFDKQLKYKWDYNKINLKIEERRKKSFDYIRLSIKD